jgi:antitoxin component YwqK of YwqJK toxin-antitoxin module
MTKFTHSLKTEAPIPFFLLLVCLLIGSCAEQRLHPDDVEYREDENGSETLYKIGEDSPFGDGKRAYVVDGYPNGNKHFEIGFLNGLRDGRFTFWQKNGIKLLIGSYRKGRRHGKFTAYGRTGEFVYKKNYKDGELDGNFTLFYPASNNDVLRYEEQLNEEGKEPGEIPVKNHLRLKVTFLDGNPAGTYRSYFHPGDLNVSDNPGFLNVTQNDLLKEEGNFSADGLLAKDQLTYYPRTRSLVVILPDGKRPFLPHPPTADGFSRAIDEAAKAILSIPKYRNLDNEPALVYSLDKKGDKIVPIWSSHIMGIAIRNKEGHLLDQKFDPTYESFNDAMIRAENNASGIADKMAGEFAEEGSIEYADFYDQFYRKKLEEYGTEVVGLSSKGEIIDILWAPLREKTVALPDRINEPWVKIQRSWNQGYASEAHWLLSNGSQMSIREKIH